MTYAPRPCPTSAATGSARRDATSGIVGDTAHQKKGVSYHLGRSQLTTDAYSARTARDKRGLTDAASAIDLGALGGSLAAPARLQRVARGTGPREQARDVRHPRDHLLGPEAVGGHALGPRAGRASTPRTGEADMSHKTHTHVSYYRDSEKRDKVAVFRPYFEQEGEPVPAVQVPTPRPKVISVPKGAWLYVRQACAADPGNVQIDPGPRDMPVAGVVSGNLHVRRLRRREPGRDDPPDVLRARARRRTPRSRPAGDCSDQVQAAIVADRRRAHISYEP